jgi:hypothetical protein
MWLRFIYEGMGICEVAREAYIAELKERYQSSRQSPAFEPQEICRARGVDVEVRVYYASIADGSRLGDPAFKRCRRAIISPEDTSISAGGGVARLLVEHLGGR